MISTVNRLPQAYLVKTEDLNWSKMVFFNNFDPKGLVQDFKEAILPQTFREPTYRTNIHPCVVVTQLFQSFMYTNVTNCKTNSAIRSIGSLGVEIYDNDHKVALRSPISSSTDTTLPGPCRHD
jgi:hypothetical protein